MTTVQINVQRAPWEVALRDAFDRPDFALPPASAVTLMLFIGKASGELPLIDAGEGKPVDSVELLAALHRARCAHPSCRVPLTRCAGFVEDYLDQAWVVFIRDGGEPDAV